MNNHYTTVEVNWKGYTVLVAAVWMIEPDGSVTISEVLLGRQNIYDDLGYMARSKIKIAVFEAANQHKQRTEVRA